MHTFNIGLSVIWNGWNCLVDSQGERERESESEGQRKWGRWTEIIPNVGTNIPFACDFMESEFFVSFFREFLFNLLHVFFYEYKYSNYWRNRSNVWIQHNFFFLRLLAISTHSNYGANHIHFCCSRQTNPIKFIMHVNGKEPHSTQNLKSPLHVAFHRCTRLNASDDL